MSHNSTSERISFVALMAALGNVLSFISIQLSPILPSIPLGPIYFSLALDLSHLATFTAALIGGSLVGGLTGLVGGSVAAFQFGFSTGNIITGIALPVGKALTGVVAGFLFKRLGSSQLRALAVTVLSYVPEAIFTIFVFIYLYPMFYGLSLAIVSLIATQIIVKAFIEMLLLGGIIAYIAESKAFKALAKPRTHINVKTKHRPLRLFICM